MIFLLAVWEMLQFGMIFKNNMIETVYQQKVSPVLETHTRAGFSFSVCQCHDLSF